MFAVELGGSLRAGSVSLLADSIDFLGDAGNYAVSLFVLSMAAVWRSRTAYAKGLVMGAFGLLVLARALWIGLHGQIPAPHTMGQIGVLALAANGAVALLLYGVFGTGAAWPDIAVACVMAVLGLSAACEVIGRARIEMR
jgi:Co/Zn/Cd efflux system component